MNGPNEPEEKSKRTRRAGASMGLGLALGAALGAALGNIAMGLSVGILIGGLGVAIDRYRQNHA